MRYRRENSRHAVVAKSKWRPFVRLVLFFVLYEFLASEGQATLLYMFSWHMESTTAVFVLPKINNTKERKIETKQEKKHAKEQQVFLISMTTLKGICASDLVPGGKVDSGGFRPPVHAPQISDGNSNLTGNAPLSLLFSCAAQESARKTLDLSPEKTRQKRPKKGEKLLLWNGKLITKHSDAQTDRGTRATPVFSSSSHPSRTIPSMKNARMQKTQEDTKTHHWLCTTPHKKQQ